MTQPKAYPKGGRCAACQHRDADCSWRDFESMQPLVAKDKSDEQLVIVKCTGFERTER
ncbi:hypothetical protein [Marinobacterium sp. BA1]|uniref:hypothetical protein n=1 Tax=Marinobacterium sp. BA1 TaxID=3138931 RepID=UPI0032E7B095